MGKGKNGKSNADDAAIALSPFPFFLITGGHVKTIARPCAIH
jgi:hypothetical protein